MRCRLRSLPIALSRRWPALLPAALLLGAAAAAAQSRAVLPAVAADLPGNAALSMPLRWSHGTLQIVIDAALLPVDLAGRTITGIRLRRPAFLGEPAYPAVQRTLTVRAGFAPLLARQLDVDLQRNRPGFLPNNPGTTLTVAGPTVFAVAASGPPAAPASLGAEFLVVPFAQPLPQGPGNLFLEFEAGDAPLAVGEVWVDAVWCLQGRDGGYAVPVGDGTCTTRAVPLHLRWNAAAGPVRGTDAALRLSGAGPGGTLVFAWIGLDPLARPPGALFAGYGGSFGALSPALAGCRQWAPFDAGWLGTSDAGGAFAVRFPLPPLVTAAGDRIGVQCAAIDTGRAGLPVSGSNGVVLVLDRSGVGDRCAAAHFPGAATVSPWPVDVGLMPVIVLEY